MHTLSGGAASGCSPCPGGGCSCRGGPRWPVSSVRAGRDAGMLAQDSRSHTV